MIEETEIRKRLSEIDEEIKQWQDDLKKELSEPREFRDEGYITHCRVIISEFKSEKNTLIWVLGQQGKKIQGTNDAGGFIQVKNIL